MRHRTRLPYEIGHADVRIPLRDATLLYARVWRPLTDEPVPALLEYEPHRLTDTTAARDWQRHPWYAGHGYASVRVDVRGHGNSEGLPGDEYSATELADGVEVITWLAAQPWCSGRVGAFGVGWGGTCALQLAALAPESLKAVVTVCSTDDRHDNDGHYLGGSVLAAGLRARAAAMLTSLCLPPDPHTAGDQWRELWLKRLEAVTPPGHTWLAHQPRDDYWKHGSVCEYYGAIEAAVLAVGGWHDPYRDTVLRLLEQLPSDRVRGLIGPWGHDYPDRASGPVIGPAIGPAIGFLQETLRWWDCHLKGVDNGVMAEPPLRTWIGGPDGGDDDSGNGNGDSSDAGNGGDSSHGGSSGGGRWTGDPAWPSPLVTTVPYELKGAPRPVASPQHTGLDAGPWLPAPDGTALPPDQRHEDARSACFDFPVTGGAVEILGRPRVTLRLRLDIPRGQAVARLCDVAPDGSSALVTRGVLNLAARHGTDRADDWQPGADEEVSFALSAAGHRFAEGHRIRLALSSAYWPWIWPQPGSAGFTLDPAGSRLDLPVRSPAGQPPDTAECTAGFTAASAAEFTVASAAGFTVAFEEPEQYEPLGVISPATLDEERPGRTVVRDVATGEWELVEDPGPSGTRLFPDGLERDQDARDTCTIEEDDPLSARVRSERRVRLHRPGPDERTPGWEVTVETRSETGCDATGFLTEDEVVCRDGYEIVFHRTWQKRVPRTAG